ncbi:MAG TPA: TonB-dependent receptor, partial [Puia sp.]
GTKKTVQSDSSGNFSLDAPSNAVLIITFSGYSQVEIPVNGRQNVDIVMNQIPKALNEVVVFGYQTHKRGDVTGAISIIDVSGVSRQPVGFVEQGLQGKAAGVRVTQSSGQPGDGMAVRIRGVGTINNNDPLYIIDGVPTKEGINFLSSDDIASITVLKDAASASIYGARSSNGVVLITTRGGKAGKPLLGYQGYYGVQTHGTLTKMCNTPEYVQLYNEAVANDNADITNPILKRLAIPDSLAMANTDWLGAIFQTAPIQNHVVSVSGGNGKTTYMVSANYFDQKGIIINSWYQRFSIRSKINIDFNDKFSISNDLNISYSDKNSVGSSGDGYGGNGGSVVRYALFRTPAIPIYNPDGSYTDLPDYPGFFGDGYNPVALAAKTDNKTNESRILGNLGAEYKFTKALSFKTYVGLDGLISQGKRFDENYGTNLRVNNPNVLTINNTSNASFIWNNTLRFNQTFNEKHNLSVLLGSEYIDNNAIVQVSSEHKFPNQDPSFRYFGNGDPTTDHVTENQQQWALFSLFGNISYNYDNRYLLSFNYRRDGSSRFGADNRYANFLSGSAGWNIAGEKWFQEMAPVFSKLKLRASYGQLGNQDIGNYPWASIVSPNYDYVFGSPQTQVLGYAVSGRGNTNVKWESSTQADAGIDIGIWNERLTMSVDYYIKKTTDMLIPVPLPAIGGSASAPYENAGSVQNQGLEIDIAYHNNIGVVKYDLSGNFATLKNNVLSLSNSTPIPGGRIDNGVYATLTTVGQPIGSFYALQMEGIFQNAADIFKHAYQGSYIKPGDVKFKDQNGDGMIDDKDRVFLGSAIPKYTYGFTADVSYSNFDLSVFFQGDVGNKLYLQVNKDIEGFYRPFNLTQRVYDERWHGEGTSNTMPRVSWLGSTNNIIPSSRFVEDASYLRLKNIQIGYTFPKKLFGNSGIKGLRIYITAQNLLTFTKYTGLDPEMHISDNVNREQNVSDVAAGIDWGTYPSAKSYVLGLNVSL